MKVLVLGAHYDDIEIGCGGTLLKHRDSGDEIYLAVTSSDDTLCGLPEVREAEQAESAKMLKALLGKFKEKDSIEKVVGFLDKVDPDTLYIPFEHDYHQAHTRTSKIGYALSRNVKISVLKYLTTTSHSYYPNYLSVIDMERKKVLVSMFASQMDRKPKFMEIMVAQNRFFGSLIPGNGFYAEGFIVHRIVDI